MISKFIFEGRTASTDVELTSAILVSGLGVDPVLSMLNLAKIQVCCRKTITGYFFTLLRFVLLLLESLSVR